MSLGGRWRASQAICAKKPECVSECLRKNFRQKKPEEISYEKREF